MICGVIMPMHSESECECVCSVVMSLLFFTAFYFSGILIASTMDRLLMNDNLRGTNGANFDMKFEIEMAKHSAVRIHRDRIDCDSFDSAAMSSSERMIHSVCTLQIAPNSDDEDVLSFCFCSIFCFFL